MKLLKLISSGNDKPLQIYYVTLEAMMTFLSNSLNLIIELLFPILMINSI